MIGEDIASEIVFSQPKLLYHSPHDAIHDHHSMFSVSLMLRSTGTPRFRLLSRHGARHINVS